MGSILLFLFSVCGAYILHRLVGFWNAIRSVENSPGRRFVFSVWSFIGMILPRIKWIGLGHNYALTDRHDRFAEIGFDIETTISMLPKPRVNIFVADPQVAKQMTSARARFPKALQQYTMLAFFGPNLVVSEADEWKKYRKVAAPAFSERNLRMVWDETLMVMDSLFEDVWRDRDVVFVENGLDLTLPIALLIIGSAGFGKRMSWKEDEVVPAGHKMTFKEAMRVATEEFFPKMFFPELLLGCTKRGRRILDGFSEVRQYMKEMIVERTASNCERRHDLFSNLLAANGHGIDEVLLNDEEIIGNIYIFLVAGHETTAHTVCFNLALLALHQDEQDKLYDHITSIARDRTPTYDDISRFTLLLANIYETLRFFPSITTIPKLAAEDCMLQTTNAAGQTLIVPVPKGTEVTIHAPGIHHNPRYWEAPYAFKPDRFLKKDWPRDAFMPFSGGARACIGRKFSETEATGILFKFLFNYKVTIKEEAQFAGETFEQKKERILRNTQHITITPLRVPLVFTRRT